MSQETLVQPLVGRAPELTTLRALVDDARSGRGRAALLLGEAGIGKTRLAESAADLAREQGFAVAWGRCPDGEAPAYWPWRQALRGLRGTAVDAMFAKAKGSSRADLFASVADAVDAATRERPAAIVLEDLHWADASSLAMAQFIVANLPSFKLVVVLTARDEPTEMDTEVATALANLPPAVLRVPLPGLDSDGIAALVRGVVGTDAPSELLTGLHERTGGNPFFVTEVARLLAVRGRSAVIDVPRGVQQVLSRRLAHLSQSAAEVLAVAAVAGTLDVDLLASVGSLPAGGVRSLLAEATRARLLTATDTGFAFAHDLVRETIYEDLSPDVRARLHARSAEALESVVDVSSADLAGQWMRAGDVRKAAPYALEAGRQAMAQMGYEHAVRYFRWALDGGAGDRVDLLTSLGEAQVLAGELASGRNTLAGAAQLAKSAGRPQDMARPVLAMGTGVGGFEVDVADERQAPLLEWAVAELPESESGLGAAVRARLSLVLAAQPGNEDRRVGLAEEAVTMARSVGDARTEVSALAAAADALSHADHVDQRSASGDRMVELARSVDDPALLLLARRMRLVALLEQGRLAEVDAEIDAYAREAERLRLPLYAWPVLIWRGMRSLMAGEVDAALEYAEEAAAVGARAGSENANMMVSTLRSAVLILTDAPPGPWVAQLEEDFDRWLTLLPPAYAWAPAAWFARAGITDRARVLVRERVHTGFSDLPRDSEWVEMVWMAGEAGRLLGEAGVMELAYDALKPYADVWVVDGIGGACYGVASFQLGRLAAAMGRTHEAEAWLSSALEAHRRAGAHLLVGLGEAALSALGAVGPADQVLPAVGAEFRRDGRLWQVAWRGARATVPDSKGMHDLAALLAQPGRDFAAIDLMDAERGTITFGPSADTGPVLDGRARDEYRRRLSELEEELAEADANADVGRSSALAAERDFLAAELASSLGLGGRPRVTGDPAERARKAVTMRVGTALKAIAEVHPALARHLRASVSTGRFCSYRPEDPVSWQM